VRWCPDGDFCVFLRPVFPASRVQQVSDLHSKFALATSTLRPLGLGEEKRRRKKKEETGMWANAQRDGRPAKYRWRPVFNATKFG